MGLCDRLKASTIERLIPDHLGPDDVTGMETLRLHLQRYEFATKHLRPGRLLDMACGVGYGTQLMVENAGGVVEAVGVDLSHEAVEYAKERYAGARVQFRQDDAMSFTDERGFDSIVSLETVEHVPDPARLIGRLIALLRPGGMLIASVPTTPSTDVNPFHLTDFTERSFRSMAAAHGLAERACLRQVQSFSPMKVVSRAESRMKDMRENLALYYLVHPSAFARRAWSTLRYGFTNRYLTVAWQVSDRSI